MSATSLLRARRAALVAALAFATIAGANVPETAPPLPPAVNALLPEARVQGGGELTWYGLSVYHGWLWSADGSFSLDEPFALDLHYQRALKGAKIAERSIDEMAQLGRFDPADLARWGRALAALFPDVKKGDHIVGVHVPGRGARFFHNGRPIGEIAEPDFARAFLIEVVAAGPRAETCRAQVHERFADLFATQHAMARRERPDGSGRDRRRAGALAHRLTNR